MDFSDQRQSYEKNSLSELNLPKDPFTLFASWMDEAVKANTPEPYAMSLATCGADHLPSVRTVLLREVTTNGFVFYTNYLSDKGEDVTQNPNAEVLFFWHDLERQIRIQGKIAKIDRAKTERYFHKRPHDSQVGAWVSNPQSGDVANREVMEAKFEEFKQKYPGNQTVPVPEFWGGYELKAERFEFWQGRANRMHDRIRYLHANLEKVNTSSWQISRLLP